MVSYPRAGREFRRTSAPFGERCLNPIVRFKFVGQNAIQIHGGMGMTDELAIGHYFKRASLIEGLFGSVDHHLKRYESLSFDAAA